MIDGGNIPDIKFWSIEDLVEEGWFIDAVKLNMVNPFRITKEEMWKL